MDIQTRNSSQVFINPVLMPALMDSSSSSLMEDIDALFDQLPLEIKEAVFDFKSVPEDELVIDELNDDIEKEVDDLVLDEVKPGRVASKRTSLISARLKNNVEIDSFDATQLYLKEIGHVPLLSRDEELYYARLAASGSERGRQRMIESNLRLVVKISRRYLNRGLPLLDLIEEGNLGLIHAVGKFDPEKGFRFSTYSTWWIRQTIERALMSQVRTIRVPIHVMKELNQCLRARRELSAKLRHEPSDQEIADLVGRPVDEVRKLLKINEHVSSLDATVVEDGTLSLADLVPNEHEDDPKDLLCTGNMAEHLNHWLTHLNEKQREIIARRFGLDGYEKRTLQMVGEDVGLTRERVRQIQVEALAKLRRLLEQNGINKDVACVA